jgi:large subunit ribosomal protein L30
MGKIRITQKKSKIGQTVRQKRTLDALGLKRINHTVELEATPQIRGMVSKISHLLSVEEVK